MLTVGQILQHSAGRLAAAGIETSRLDARLLLAEVMGMEPQRLSMRAHLEPSPAEIERFDALLGRRLNREPMSHVLGRRGFWTLELAVSADTLTPRPDTETVVEAVLSILPDRGRPRRILDLGTGTGCILLALLSELGYSTGLGIDRSEAALAVAGRNAGTLGLSGRASFRIGDWGGGLDGTFDVIVSNPPYIPDGDIDALAPEVSRFEPRLALAGGADGLDCYRALAPDLARLLAPDGVAALEVGAGQAAEVAGLMAAAGLCPREIRRDLGGIERCIVVSL